MAALVSMALASSMSVVSPAVAGPVKAQRPALVLSKVAGPSSAHAGGKVRVSLRVHAVRSHAATGLRVYLSTDRRHNRGDVALASTIRVPRLKAGKSKKVAARVGVPRSARAGRYHVIVCGHRAKDAKCGSARGVVKVTRAAAVPSVYYLKVTGVSGSYDMTYDSVENGPNCTLTAHDHYATSPSTQSDNAYDGSFDVAGGAVSVDLHKTGTASGSVTCPGAPSDSHTCQVNLDDEGSYYLDIDHVSGAASATLKFHPLQQPYNDCSSVVKDGGETTGVTDPTIAVTVPWSTLTGQAAFTVSANGTFHDQTHVVTRDYSVTLRRVDKAGNALQ